MSPAPTPILPKDLAVRLSVTERCQLRCTYCMPARGCSCDRDAGRELSHAQLTRLLAAMHGASRVRRLRFTGGEPLLRRDLEELVSSVRQLGIGDLAMTTNGQLLAKRAAGLRRAGLGRLNISIDSLDTEVFRRVTRGGVLARTLEGVEAALSEGFEPPKLNMVVIRGMNEGDCLGLLEYAASHACVLRYLELMPIGAGAERFREEFVSSEEVREGLRLAGCRLEPLPWDLRETSRDWRVTLPDGRVATCGFVSPTSEPFCDGCRRVRITSDGWLYGCLARNERQDLASVLKAHELGEAGQAWLEALALSYRSKFAEKYTSAVPSMSMIGG